MTAVLLASVLCNATLAQNESPRKPNAAPLYLKAIEEMKSALTDSYTNRMELPPDEGDLTSREWQDVVAKSAVAWTLFTAATQISGCAFPPAGDGEATGLRSKILSLVDLRKLATARGMQQATKDPRGACTTALQILQYGRHCSLDPTLMGIALSHDAEEHAAQILDQALPRLALRKDAKNVAKRFRARLDDHIKTRPSRPSLADTAKLEFTWLLESGFSAEAKKNPMILSARKRAGAILDEMLQPLRADPPIADAEFRKRFDERVAKLKKVTNKKNASDILKNGRGETLASVLVLMGIANIPRFVETHSEQTKRLLHSQQLLVKFLGADKDADSGKDRLQAARKDNAVDLYHLAIIEARRALGVPDGQMLNLPHEVALNSYQDKFWVSCTEKSAVARSLFAQASQGRNCTFKGLGEGRTQLDELSPVLMQLRTLVFAHAAQNIKARPSAALSDAFCLLDHAHQLRGVPFLQAVALANLAEQNALAIIEVARIADRDQSERTRWITRLEAHQKRHGTLAQFATMMQDAIMTELEATHIFTSDEHRSELSNAVTSCLAPVANHGMQPADTVLSAIRDRLADLKQPPDDAKWRRADGANEVAKRLREKLMRLEGLIRTHEQLAAQISERLAQIPR